MALTRLTTLWGTRLSTRPCSLLRFATAPSFPPSQSGLSFGKLLGYLLRTLTISPSTLFATKSFATINCCVPLLTSGGPPMAPPLLHPPLGTSAQVSDDLCDGLPALCSSTTFRLVDRCSASGPAGSIITAAGDSLLPGSPWLDGVVAGGGSVCIRGMGARRRLPERTGWVFERSQWRFPAGPFYPVSGQVFGL